MKLVKSIGISLNATVDAAAQAAVANAKLAVVVATAESVLIDETLASFGKEKNKETIRTLLGSNNSEDWKRATELALKDLFEEGGEEEKKEEK